MRKLLERLDRITSNNFPWGICTANSKASLVKISTLLLSATIISIATNLAATQPASAQPSLRNCIRGMTSEGVSPDKAAELCAGGVLALDQCVEQKRSRTYKGTPRQRKDGKTEYLYSISAFNGEKIAGAKCRTDYWNFATPVNVCQSSSMKVNVLDEQTAVNQCRGLVGSTGTKTFTSNQISSNKPIFSKFGGSPHAMAKCIDRLLYRTRVQKPFPGWMCVKNDSNCKTVKIRTELSEEAAVQACQTVQ